MMKYSSLLLVMWLFIGNSHSLHAQKKLYWTDAINQVVEKSDIQGNAIVPLVSQDLQTPYSLTIDTFNHKIYWTDSGQDKIQRSDLDGTNIEDVIITGLAEPRGIAIDLINNKLYWVDFGMSKIERSNLDGSIRESIITTGIEEPHGIALDLVNNHIYWTDRKAGKIQRSNLEGNDIVDLVVGLSNPAGIELDLVNGKLYWTDSKADNIGRANLNGGLPEILVSTGIDTPFRIRLNVSEGKMYWTDFSLKLIKKANLDGTDVETVLDQMDGLSGPSGLAIVNDVILANEEPVVKYDFDVFPNPTFGKVKFRNVGDLGYIKNVSVYNISGQFVYSAALNNNTNEIDLSHLMQGVYLLQLETKDTIQNVKLIKLGAKP